MVILFNKWEYLIIEGQTLGHFILVGLRMEVISISKCPEKLYNNKEQSKKSFYEAYKIE